MRNGFYVVQSFIVIAFKILKLICKINYKTMLKVNGWILEFKWEFNQQILNFTNILFHWGIMW